jgi:hypothetical protein
MSARAGIMFAIFSAFVLTFAWAVDAPSASSASPPAVTAMASSR